MVAVKVAVTARYMDSVDECFVLCEIMFIYVLDGPYLMTEMDGTWRDNLNTARFTGHK
jgi:phosphoribulokinase